MIGKEQDIDLIAQWMITLFYHDSYTFRMAAKLRRVHALYAADAIAEIAGMCNYQFIFKNISALA